MGKASTVACIGHAGLVGLVAAAVVGYTSQGPPMARTSLEIALTAATEANLPPCTAQLDGDVASVLSPPSLWACSNGSWGQFTCTSAQAGQVAYANSPPALWACVGDRWTQIDVGGSDAGSGSGQTPLASLGNLVLWLDANSGVAQSASGRVTSWADQSGNGNDVSQSAAGSQPTYFPFGAGPDGSLAYLAFGGSGSPFLDNTTTNLTPNGGDVTVIVACQPTAGGSGGTPFAMRRSEPLAIFDYVNVGGTNYVYSDGATNASNVTIAGSSLPSTGAAMVMDYSVHVGSPLGFTIDGVPQQTSGGAPTDYTGSTGFSVGGREDYPSPWQGDIYEIVVYSGLLSATNLAAARDAVASEWGVSVVNEAADAGEGEDSGPTADAGSSSDASSTADASAESGLTADAGASDATTDASPAADAGQVNPASLGNLVLWLDSNSGVTHSGGTVSAWADQSGQDNSVSQSTAGSQPTYHASGAGSGGTMPYLTFGTGGVNTFLDSTTTNLAPSGADVTVVVAGNLPSTSTGGALLTLRRSDPVATFLYLSAGSEDYVYSDGVSVASVIGASPLPSTGSRLILDYAYHLGSSPTFDIDGTPFTASGEAATYDGTTGFTAGSREDTGGQGWQGDIYAVLVYHGVLSPADLAAARNYLAAEWGISVASNATDAGCVTADASASTDAGGGVSDATSDGGSDVSGGNPETSPVTFSGTISGTMPSGDS